MSINPIKIWCMEEKALQRKERMKIKQISVSKSLLRTQHFIFYKLRHLLSSKAIKDVLTRKNKALV